MKVTGKPVPTSVGIFFIGFALLAAAFIFPSAKGAQSPILYVCIFGGLFVGIPPHWESASLLRIDGSESLDERYRLFMSIRSYTANVFHLDQDKKRHTIRHEQAGSATLQDHI